MGPLVSGLAGLESAPAQRAAPRSEGGDTHGFEQPSAFEAHRESPCSAWPSRPRHRNVAPLIPEFAAPLLHTRKNPRSRALGRLRKTAAIPLLISVGARGFEPPTFCSQIDGRDIAGACNGSQPSRTFGFRIDRRVQRSEAFTPFRRRFTSPVLQSRQPPADGFAGRQAAWLVRRDRLQAVRHGCPAARTGAELDPSRRRVASGIHLAVASRLVSSTGKVNKN
jgi:hypothetical protein